MKQLTALVWKEWHEVRILFAIALFVFLGLPIIGGLQFVWFHKGRFSVDTSGWVIFLGSLFAIVVGVGIVTRDVNGKLEEFWRSRPVSVRRWLIVKYAVGLLVVLVSLIVPLLIERSFGSKTIWPADVILAWHPFLWMAIYSIAFAIACIVRRGAHAAMLSASITLLLYFLPSIVPPLKFLGIIQMTTTSATASWRTDWQLVPWTKSTVQYEPWQLHFLYGMFAISLVAIVVAILALRRDWRIEAGRKMLYWSVGGALLLLFATAAFQVGANLPVLQTVEFDRRREEIVDVVSDGKRAIVTGNELAIGQRGGMGVVRILDIAAEGITVAATLKFPLSFREGAIWIPEKPDVLFSVGSGWISENREAEPLRYPVITTIDLRGSGSLSSLQFPELAAKGWGFNGAQIIGDRLYVLGPGVMIYDIADRYHPKLLQTVPMTPALRAYSRYEMSDDLDVVTYPLLEIPGLTPRQKLQFVNVGATSLHGDTLVRMERGRSWGDFSVYDLKELTETTATFQRRSKYERSLMQRLFGGDIDFGLQRSGDLLYGVGWSQVSGAHVVVVDVSSRVPSQVGHFAFGEKRSRGMGRICPLPDGSVLAVGEGAIMVLGAPKRR